MWRACLPTIRDLTERQHQLFFLFHSVDRPSPSGGARAAVDDDVADAAAAMAATLETAARGVIYEHTPAVARGAQSLVADDEGAAGRRCASRARTSTTAKRAIALRAIERAHGRPGADDENDTVYLRAREPAAPGQDGHPRRRAATRPPRRAR